MKHHVLQAMDVDRPVNLAGGMGGLLHLVEGRNMSPRLRLGHHLDSVDVVVSVDSVVSGFVTNIDSMLALLVRAQHD